MGIRASYQGVIITLVTILMVLITPLYGNAADKWSKQDYGLEVVCLGLKYLDYRQTLVISRHPELYQDWNPVLGAHPSEGRVHTYFALTAAGHVLVTHLLPSKWRPYWQIFWIGLSAYNVEKNYSIGIRLRW